MSARDLDQQHPDREQDDDAPACMSRRHFLLTGGVTVTMVALGGLSSLVSGEARAEAGAQYALKATYPRRRIGTLSSLKTGKPIDFSYPYQNISNILVKLGVPAGGGVGPQQDVVAFTQQCTHMGGPLQGTFKATHQIMGPCPLHLTTFDLTRHGMVVAGHGTESLPQIVLETQGDDIYAVGVMGLIYGYSANLAGRRWT